MIPIIIYDFSDVEDVFSQFEVTEHEREGVEILLAYYCYEDYSGEAFVLFRKDGELYEVNGSHCSCYGLEGQWTPESTTTEALRYRIEHGRLGIGYHDEDRFANELTAVLDELEGK